jgi:hypothetical protein
MLVYPLKKFLYLYKGGFCWRSPAQRVELPVYKKAIINIIGITHCDRSLLLKIRGHKIKLFENWQYNNPLDWLIYHLTQIYNAW